MNWYRLVPSDQQWALGEDYTFTDGAKVEDIWALGRCSRIDDQRARPFQILGGGCVVDFNPTTHMGIVVSRRLGELLRSLLPANQVQFLPAVVSGGCGEWEALNILSCVDCINYERSEVHFHEESHLHKANSLMQINRLIIDPLRATGHHMFRVADWMPAVIVSETIKSRLESAKITGVEFWLVT